MIQRLLLFLALSAPLFAFATNNMVIYSLENKRFTVFIGGVKQNDRPEANVKVTNLPGFVYAVRIEFEEATSPAINQNVYLVDGCAEVTNQEFSFIVEQPFRGQWKLRVTGMNEINPNAALVPGQAVVVYRNVITAPVNPPTPVVTVSPAPVAPCTPMAPADFTNAKASVEKQAVDDSKLKVAKQIANSNCLTTAQVKEIMQLFTMESAKLEWAKFAYGKTVDPGNYFQLNDEFMFNSSVDELNKYIEAQKK